MLMSYSVSLYRFSSVQLLGDLLFHISGVTGKMTTETASEDDNFGTAASNKVCLSNRSAVIKPILTYTMSGMKSQFNMKFFLCITKKRFSSYTI